MAAARVPFLALIALALSPLASVDTAWSKDPVKLVLDQARVVRIGAAADTVIIGNPMIADATVRDSRTLILTGRSFGTTNLIVLDQSGQLITEELITVETGDPQVVTMFKGARNERASYSCTPICEPTLTIGDQTESFEARRNQINGRNELASGGK